MFRLRFDRYSQMFTNKYYSDCEYRDQNPLDTYKRYWRGYIDFYIL